MGVRIVFLDCDGTLTKVKSSWEYLHRRLGLWTNKADAYQELFRAGKINYQEFCERDALLWKGIPVSRVVEVVGEIPYQKGAKKLVAALKKDGVFTVMVSTGLSILVNKVKGDLGVDLAMANDLVECNGLLTGEICINVGYNEKGERVRETLRARGLHSEDACAVGDGEGDIGMFQAVGLSLGFHPEKAVLPFLTHSLNENSLCGALGFIRACGERS